MKRLALIALTSVLAAPAGADTFELSDPANEAIQPPPAEEETESVSGEGPGQEFAQNSMCTVDTASGACSCIDKVKAQRLSMTQEECAERVRQSLNMHRP